MLSAATSAGRPIDIMTLLRLDPRLLHAFQILAPALPPNIPVTSVPIAQFAMVRGRAPALPPLPRPPSIEVTSVTSGNVGVGGDTPIVVVATPGVGTKSSSGAVAAAPSQPAVAGSLPASQPAANQSAHLTPATTGILPDTRHVQVDGSLTADQNSTTIVVPVSATTQAVGFSVVDASAGRPSERLQVDHVTLVDSDGIAVADVGPLVNPQTNVPTSAVTVALAHAPVGGSLIVQISGPLIASTATASGWANSGASGTTIAYVVDVQKLEAGVIGSGAGVDAASSQGGATATAGTTLGALNWTSGAETDTIAASLAGAPALEGRAPTTAPGAGDAALADGEPAGSDATLADLGGRVTLGPLASRTAAPLGPSLATLAANPAPSVDRYERALSQEIDEHDAETGAVAANRPGRGRTGAADDIARLEGSFVAIAGPGALPLKVSATAGGDRLANLDALLAALPGAPSASGVAVRSAIASDDEFAAETLLISLTATVSSSQHDRRPAPDYLTSACILALGMGLTAGPLMPDLLRLIPSRASRWRFRPNSPAAGRRAASSGDPRFGPWSSRPVR